MQATIPFEKIDEHVRKRYKYSFMSNAKWKKLLNALGDAFPCGCVARYKLIYGDEPGELRFDQADEQFFAEPTLYKEVEWIEFPDEYEDWINPDNRKAGRTRKSQDLHRVASIIKSVGAFETEEHDGSLRIYGYR